MHASIHCDIDKFICSTFKIFFPPQEDSLIIINYLFAIRKNGFFSVLFQKSPETVPLLLTSNGLAAGCAALGEELAKAVSTVRLVISAKRNLYISIPEHIG
jgi:hypothetical protein